MENMSEKITKQTATEKRLRHAVLELGDEAMHLRKDCINLRYRLSQKTDDAIVYKSLLIITWLGIVLLLIVVLFK